MRPPDLDLDLLRCLLAVAEAGGFTAAGDRLGLTQSAVTLRIRRLEDRVGRTLLRRTSRGSALTEDGETLAGYARRLLALHDEAALRLAGPGLEGEVRLGVADYFAPQHLPGLLARFAAQRPGVRLDVRLGLSHDLIAAVAAGELDLALAKREAGDRRGRRIATEPLVWAGAEGMAVPAAGPLPLLAMPAPCFYRAAAAAALERAGRSSRVVFTSGSVLGVQAAARAGLGLAVLGRAAVGHGMRALGPADGLPPLPACEVALYGEGKRLPLVAPLVEAIGEVLRGAAPPLAA